MARHRVDFSDRLTERIEAYAEANGGLDFDEAVRRLVGASLADESFHSTERHGTPPAGTPAAELAALPADPIPADDPQAPGYHGSNLTPQESAAINSPITDNAPGGGGPGDPLVRQEGDVSDDPKGEADTASPAGTPATDTTDDDATETHSAPSKRGRQAAPIPPETSDK